MGVVSAQPTYQTITIPAGSVGYIPAGATVIGKSLSGDADVSSDCLDSDIPEFECYEVGFISSADANNDTPLTHDNTYLESMTLNGTTYTIHKLFKQLTTSSFDVLPKGIMLIYNVIIDPDEGGTDKKDGCYLRFKTAPQVAAQIEFKAVGEGYPNGIYMRPYSIDCPDSSSNNNNS